ncbi:hypothetical protein [Flavobacterium terrisoli]|uniref:hypothetical protein n=1 Tax=Flavobacterium terrisoli TaxID=3242195 RepID=UPI0025426F87|nr:hypothetical protein [Flavobacterium buctense]
MKKIIVFIAILSIQSIFAQQQIIDLVEPPTIATNEVDNHIYSRDNINVLPRFEGGVEKFYQFFYANFKIPEGLSITKLYVSFIVEKDGSLSEGVVNGNFGSAVTQEVNRVLKLSPKWIPGKKYDQTIKMVRCTFALPFEFGNTITPQKK